MPRVILELIVVLLAILWAVRWAIRAWMNGKDVKRLTAENAALQLENARLSDLVVSQASATPAILAPKWEPEVRRRATPDSLGLRKDAKDPRTE